MLRAVTVGVNFLGLIAAVWLGLYIVSRSRRSLIAWLTGLTLWALAGLCLNILLALDPPPYLGQLPFWMRIFFPFWPLETLAHRPSAWLQGWSVVPSVAFWHHATMLMRPGPLNPWRWARILASYALAIVVIFLQPYTSVVFVVEGGNPLFLNTLLAGPWYWMFAVCLLIFTGMCIINLTRSARAAESPLLRQQLITLIVATLVAGLTGPISILGSALGIPVPMIAISLPLCLAVGLTGYGVARYSALSEGRTMRRDFAYNAIASILVTLVYLGLVWLIGKVYPLPAGISTFIVLVAVVTHSIVDLGRSGLDTFFYRRHTRQLRDNLRKLVRLAGQHEDIGESLTLALESLCSTVRAIYGLLFIFEEGRPGLAAAYRWRGDEINPSVEDLLADDFIHLDAGHFAPPLHEAALLIPLYGETTQIGALVLGRPVNGLHYSALDIDRLLDPGDRLADAIQGSRRIATYLSRIAEGPEKSPPEFTLPDIEISIDEVEFGLRNLHDYATLADSMMMGMKLVQRNLPEGMVTHLERGKAINQALCTAIEKLRPSLTDPKSPIPRVWYAYLILRDAYLNDLSNREIMARLYISEGTFNRTRRAAVRSVRRALHEMEATIQ